MLRLNFGLRGFSPLISSQSLTLPHINTLIHRRNFYLSNPIRAEEIKVGRPDEPFTIYPEEKLKARVHGSFFKKTLDPKYRLGNVHMYFQPDCQAYALAKRATLIFAIAGLVFSQTLANSNFVLPIFYHAMAVFSLLPYPTLQILSRPVVARIWRLYDTSKPQTLENLVDDETLIFERIDWRGGKAFNELIKVNTLRLPTPEEKRFGWVNLVSEDPVLKTVKYYYVKDDVYGMNMTRIWSIAEKNSGVDNGRHFFKY